jgi:tripartite-type tricarboxylate transporter receptor subunit TctC
MRRRQVLSSIALASIAMPGLVRAQADRPIRLSLGFAAGTSLDNVTRLLAEKMRPILNQPILVENRPSAGGRVAAELLKTAPADGTVYMPTPIVVPVLAPMVFRKLNYDPLTDMVPVGLMTNFNFALGVHPSHPAKTMRELVTWLKSNPAKANFGSPAPGSLPHFFGLLIGSEASVPMVHVPYNGGGPLQAAVMAGDLPVAIDVVSEFVQNHRAGKVRVLATSGAQRSSALPDVPTFVEQGFTNIVGNGWFAVYAPPKTPAAEIARFNRALNQALAMPDVLERLTSLAFEPGGGSPADLASLMQRDTAKWGPIVAASGFRVD